MKIKDITPAAMRLMYDQLFQEDGFSIPMSLDQEEYVNVLKKMLLFFEEEEDYEKCSRIRKLLVKYV